MFKFRFIPLQFLFVVTLAITFSSPVNCQEKEMTRDEWNKDCLAKIQKTVLANQMGTFTRGRTVCCSFFIDRTGEVTGLKIHRTSGLSPIDLQAKFIVDKTAFKKFNFFKSYKVGAIACFDREVKVTLRFYAPDQLPPNYDYLNRYTRLWFKKVGDRIKRHGIERGKDNKWVKVYQLEKPVYCVFRLGLNGAADDLSISKSSGDQEIDAVALRLIEKASPFGTSSVGKHLKEKPIQVSFVDGDVKLSFAEETEETKD